MIDDPRPLDEAVAARACLGEAVLRECRRWKARADDFEIELEACRQALANTNTELRRVREELESILL